MRTSQVNAIIANICGYNSSKKIRYYAKRAAAVRRANTLRKQYAEPFHFYIGKFDVTPAAQHATYEFAVCVEHPALPDYNTPLRMDRKCV